MATRDFYNILGVGRDATPDDIKRAYRNLARRWHPDHNRGPDAASRFKDITEAYRILSDPDERARYDRLGPLYTQDGRPPRPEDINEMVGSVLGGIFRRRGREPGEDLRYTVSLTLEEVASGVEKDIVVPRRVRCRTCGGDGARPGDGRESCAVCRGSGKATGPRLFRTECYHCDGRGYTIAHACETCSGGGLTSLDDALRVRVPAGVATGQKLKLAGKGNAPRGSGPEGDLYVIVNVADHALFRRRGEDLVVDLPLTYAELLLGADVEVPTLEGTTTIRVPAGSPPGKVLRLAGRGLPRVGRGDRGDLHLQIVLEIPEGIDEEQRAALAAWAGALQPSAHPRRAVFDRAVEARR